MAFDTGGGGSTDVKSGASGVNSSGAPVTPTAPQQNNPYIANQPTQQQQPQQNNTQQSSSGGFIPKDVWDLLQKLNYPGKDINAPAPDWAVQFTEDELDASNRGDVFGHTLEGFTFPKSLSVADFSQIESWAHTFAANSNWKYMPTGQMIMEAYNNGLTDKKQAFQQWYGKLGTEDKSAVPWLQYGYTREQYNQTHGNYGDVLNNLTGSEDTGQVPGDLLSQAMGQNWSTSKFEAAARKSLSTASPWLDQKYGYNYQSWQAYKRTNKQAIQDRFGANGLNDQNFLANVDNPLQTGTQAHGGQIGYGTGPKGAWGNASNLLDANASTVR